MDGGDRNFHHPYQPYQIQKEFMNAVYECIEQKKVGIFESPTGTGKSLSLICGSLSWLREFRRSEFEQFLEVDAADLNEPSWVIEHARERKRKAATSQRADFEARLARIRAKEQRARQRYDSGEPSSKRQRTSNKTKNEHNDEDEFMLDDYVSDTDTTSHRRNGKGSTDIALSVETQALIEKAGGTVLPKKDEEEPIVDELKVYFCSRTHSQLSQFANELRKVKLPPSIPADPGRITDHSVSKEDESPEELKHVTLGSRKSLCIHPKVSKLGSLSAINEKCLELQQSSTPSDTKCPFLPNKENQTLVNDFRDHTLAKIRDIEEMGAVGKRIGICPYYASRASTNPAEIVTLPYPLLLQKTARDALNLSLKNHVVIIDEAHNLMDAITNIHSCSLSLSQLHLARSQLGAYLQKFRNRLKGKNRVYITQLVRLIDSLTSYLEKHTSGSKHVEGLVSIQDLMSGKGCDQINLFKLMNYLQESKLARKVEGYAMYAERVSQDSHETRHGRSQDWQAKSTTQMPVVNQVQSFLLTLTHPAAEGRFFYHHGNEKDQSGPRLDYTLLDPTYHFQEIVEEARAVILAGGTMSPMEDYTEHLFRFVPIEKILTLSCGHVIPKSNLMASPISRGPTGIEFDFTFEKRKSDTMIDELGRAVLEFCKYIPDGVVVFFPSYAYLNTAIKHWKSSSSPNSEPLWNLMSKHKRMFVEPKSDQPPPTKPSSTSSATKEPSTIDALLTTYSSHIHTTSDSTSGALLLAVIGGSLSEGINFSDRLGRGIIVVGLPFPNPYASEWAAKLEFISQRAGRNATGSSAAKGKGAAKDFTLNTTMRAVNQSIGRAIRHKDDYAAIILLDRRYESARVQERLPGWIRDCISSAVQGGFNEVAGSIKRFFEGKKTP